MRYQVIEFLRLVLALVFVLGAFAGGLAVGWWRWGRGDRDDTRPARRNADLGGALFSPDDHEPVIDLTDRHPVGAWPGDPAGTEGRTVFGTGVTTPPARPGGLNGFAGAIGPTTTTTDATSERTSP